MFPFTTPLKIFPELEEETLYGVEPPEIVILELCPAKIEIEVWLRDNKFPLLVLLTFAVKDAQLPANAQILIVEVPTLAFAIKVKILLFMLACTMLGLEFEAT